MTKREAKRRLCASLAWSLRGDIDNGSSFLVDGDDGNSLPDADARMMREAADELIDELERRGRC